MADIRTPHEANLLRAATTDLGAAVRADQSAVPFAVELSLEPLVRFWTGVAGKDTTVGAIARLIRERLGAAPELTDVIPDAGVLAKHRELLDLLMAAVFPRACWERDYGAALVPYQLVSFYATPECERTLVGPDGRITGTVNVDAAAVSALRRLYAYDLILRRVYGLDLAVERAFILTAPDRNTGLDRHFKVEFDDCFIDVQTRGDAIPLPDDVRLELQAHRIAPDALPDIFPADRFTLRGFGVLRAFDVTDQEVLSSLKRDLIDRESIVSAARFHDLQVKLSTLFRRPDLRLGVAAVQGDQVLILNDTAKHEHACIFADSRHHRTNEFFGSVYERAFETGRPLIVEDLVQLESRTAIENELIRTGNRNLVVAPLHYQGRVIGTLDLGSPHPGDLNASHMTKLAEVLPLFAVAVQRSVEELNARIQAFIKEKCTAIHPTVEWRFRRAVLNTMERRVGRCTPESTAEMEPIVFERVHPLYALADIRGSSTHRALAIQADLRTQLGLAREVLASAYRARRFPALDELRYRIEQRLDRVTAGIGSGDEVAVLTFLRADIEPLFQHLSATGSDVRARIDAYRAALDPRLGVVYDQRRRFEHSVTRIAETISSYLDLEEQTAQTMAPHYFEKQQTDGVDYQIYVGTSLLEDGGLDPLALKNLRLWQLMVTCGMAIRAEQLRAELPLPLEVTHLVLVQHLPLAIRFRFDEKRFDVDGAYDIRYEIVKKRIDKALVRGSTERVTQPGAIAIVYSQRAEAEEYRHYLRYLRTLGYLAGDVEELDLEELQGVQGLRALRVPIDLSSGRAAEPIAMADVRAIS
jgi:hypothetical protein